jgi:hypothetical protein
MRLGAKPIHSKGRKMKLTLLRLLSVLTLAMLIANIALHVRRKYLHDKSQQCAVIHKPAKAECPKGYTQEQTPRFTEKDGSKVFACFSQDSTKSDCIDFLAPGEHVELLFGIPGNSAPEPPAPKPAGERKL